MSSSPEHTTEAAPAATPPLLIGWAHCEITPQKLPVLVSGQFYARVSEGVDDPLLATALALDNGAEQAVFVACDVVCVSDELRDAVRQRLLESGTNLDPQKVILNATHTHSGPEIRIPSKLADGISSMGVGVGLEVASVEETVEFLAGRIAACILEAWNGRQPGAIAFGLDYAVIGRNRRWVDKEGRATMYGLGSPAAKERFRHVEGYEDHSLDLLATYDSSRQLTGVVINLASTAQESMHSFRLSADFWHETRAELAVRLGGKVAVLPQCSASGDQTSELIHGREAHQRMLDLRGKTKRQDIACRIADAVGRILPGLEATAVNNPVLAHAVLQLDLPTARVSREQAVEARTEAEKLRASHEAELARLAADPKAREQPRWYVDATAAFRRGNWYLGVVRRFEEQQAGRDLTRPAEVHAVRIGDVAFASNPFEYYLDFGIEIKVRSPFIQTFLVQLAGRGTYVPSPRSVAGGGYGSVPASNPIGPDGGRILAEHTLELLRELAPNNSGNGDRA